MDYKEAGKKAFQAYGLGHLSKSTVSNLEECHAKWALGKIYAWGNLKTASGQLFHSVKEKVQKEIMAVAMEGTHLTDGAMYAQRYAEALEKVMSTVDVPDLFTQAAYDEYNSMLDSASQVLCNLRTFKRDLLALKDKIVDNFGLEHLRKLVSTPALAVEKAVVWVDDLSGVPDAPPYLGYIDEMWFDYINNWYVICDLKSHAKAPDMKGPLGADVMFQAWLYAISLVQMGIIPPDRKIVFQAKRIIRKFGKKSSEILVYDHYLTDATGQPLNILDLTPKMASKIKSSAERLRAGIKSYAHSSYGCRSCDFVKVCEHSIVPRWSDQKEEEGSKDDE